MLSPRPQYGTRAGVVVSCKKQKTFVIVTKPVSDSDLCVGDVGAALEAREDLDFLNDDTLWQSDQKPALFILAEPTELLADPGVYAGVGSLVNAVVHSVAAAGSGDRSSLIRQLGENWRLVVVIQPLQFTRHGH